MLYRFWHIALGAVALLVAARCNFRVDKTPLSANPPPLTASFASIQKNIIRPLCFNCHDADRHRGDVDLSTYKGVIETVIPEDPKTSRFYTSVENDYMPDGNQKRKLTAKEKEIIAEWILKGAKP